MKRQGKKRGENDGQRMVYAKPQVERVDLALAETLSSGCKLEGVCDDAFQPGGAISDAGS